ncbi:putative L,D-transpeptidase YnhG [Aquicella siphonis]|uniref:Putative L,D-transpeptidase YnhG n=1 Tax=Aquicella siphonis TaxID=254247 RepID=A0A5E4PCY8_9COXI|nr:L,D-transpeptidase family protein [Aquicella siphonis]VVC74730.1 putative L,D-transpeptidase YnhG [Aquicella siphonis]
MNVKLGKALSAAILFASTQAIAAYYPVPPENQSIIGQIKYSSAGFGESVVKLSQHYDVGYNAMEKANPHVNLTKPLSYGTSVKIPSQHLLPNQPREGIIINLPEMRMYYFVPGTSQVATYPIGIGKIGKTIPITMAKITKKAKDPVWVPPEDIREFNLAQGVVLPQVMPPGPDNPLGPYAIYMSVPTYLIHSTIFPESVGKRASFGCIRMYESDIKDFFPTINSGIPVAIINSPIKVGWQGNRLYIEAHPPLEEHNGAFDATLPGTVTQINNLTKNQDTLIDWQAVAFVEKERDGLPHEIGVRISS